MFIDFPPSLVKQFVSFHRDQVKVKQVYLTLSFLESILGNFSQA